MLRRLQQLRRFVLALSGAHEETLALVPTERARFESLGWAVLITSCMAAVSMWFALASAVGINGILAIPVALFWGLVIMGIDRWLITSMPADSKRKFAMAVPRLALALLLGTLISTPLVLRIFQSEINAQIAVMQQGNYNTFLRQQGSSQVSTQVVKYKNELQQLNTVINSHGASTGDTASDPQLVAYENQKTQLEGELTHWTNLKAQYYQEYTCQLYGGPTCPKKGFGPAAKDSQQNYNDASQQVDAIKGQINGVQKEIQQRDKQLNSSSVADENNRYQEALNERPLVQNEYNTAVQRQGQLQATYFAQEQAAHGILVRLEALSQLSQGNFTVTAARFLLFLLFLVIECLPVTVKLLQPPGLYEEALGNAKEAHRRDFQKFYSSRSRLGGGAGGGFPPNGSTAVLQLRPEFEPSLDPIWNSTRVLSRAPGDPADEQPTEAFPDQGSGWGPGGRLDYGPDSTAGRQEPGWPGGPRWREHWQRQPDEDEAGPPEPLRPEPPRPPGARPELGGAPTRRDAAPGLPLGETRLDYGYPADLSRGDVRQPERDAGGETPDRDEAYQGESWPGRDERAVPGSEEPVPARSDVNGSGIPLSWEEDE
jgi:hypothetical protein